MLVKSLIFSKKLCAKAETEIIICYKQQIILLLHVVNLNKNGIFHFCVYHLLPRISVSIEHSVGIQF